MRRARWIKRGTLVYWRCMNDTASAMVLYEDPSFLIVTSGGIPTVPLQGEPLMNQHCLDRSGTLPEVLTVNGRNGWGVGAAPSGHPHQRPGGHRPHRCGVPASPVDLPRRLFIKEYQAKSSAKERVMQARSPIRTRILHCGAVEVAVGASFATGASIAVRCARCSATARATSRQEQPHLVFDADLLRRGDHRRHP